MNLVVGATGMVGTEICRLIAASGKPVKALVRASSDPAISTASAMPFAYTPGENTPHTTDQDGCLSLIDAARGAGEESAARPSM